jgi:ABC-type transport system involved in multi-copper enzyme maturation permease subunit
MNATIAAQMTGADFLKLRKKRGTLIWALVLALAPVIIFFAVKAIQHSSDPLKHEPAGGLDSYNDGLRVIALLFCPLAAILIGVEAGTGDLAAGVFRDMVVTGRSRLQLFFARVPAALGLCWAVIVTSYLLLVAGTFIFASNLPTPSFSLLLEGLGFMLLATGVVCVVAVGFSALTGSKPASITALIGWQLVASPLIASISSLGGLRDGVLSEALVHFGPVRDRGTNVVMAGGTATLVLVAWLALFLALGAWRTQTMDA